MIWLVSIGSVVVTAAASAALIVALRLRKAITQATLAAVSANTTLGEALKRLGALEASTSEASRLLAADTASQATKLDATIEANAAAINQLEQRLKAQSESNDAAWEAMRVALLERIDEGDKAGARALAQLAELVDSTNKALQSDITAVRVIAENATVQVATISTARTAAITRAQQAETALLAARAELLAATQDRAARPAPGTTTEEARAQALSAAAELNLNRSTRRTSFLPGPRPAPTPPAPPEGTRFSLLEID
jgi:hypothetical protein